MTNKNEFPYATDEWKRVDAEPMGERCKMMLERRYAEHDLISLLFKLKQLTYVISQREKDYAHQ